jgi:hypothetical protein
MLDVRHDQGYLSKSFGVQQSRWIQIPVFIWGEFDPGTISANSDICSLHRSQTSLANKLAPIVERAKMPANEFSTQ